MKKLTLILLSILMIATLVACGNKKCKQHTYDNACDVTCNECNEERMVEEHDWEDADCDTPKTCSICGLTDGDALGHTPEEDDGDCTTAITCANCETVTTPAKDNHEGGVATCVSGKVCEICNTEYDTAKNPDNHVSEKVTYTANEDNATHKKVHECCGATADEEHDFNFETGKCEFCDVQAVAEIRNLLKGNTIGYYLTMNEAFESIPNDGENYAVFAITDYDENFTIPQGVSFIGESNRSTVNNEVVVHSFSGMIINNGAIYGGNFNGKVTNQGDIYSGTFIGEVINECDVSGGTYNGTFTNEGDVSGGTFNGKIINNRNIHNTQREGAFTFGEDFSINNNGAINCEYHFLKVGICRLCGEKCDHEDSAHDATSDNGDGTHSFTCTVCSGKVTVAHTGNEQTCLGYYCNSCDLWYGEKNPENHEDSTIDENGQCGCGEIVVASVGDVFYNSFESALNNWTNGTTLKLYANVDYAKEVEILGGYFTLDLNGRTYSREYCIFNIGVGAELTVMDNNDKPGELKMTGDGDYAIFVRGTFNLTGGRVTSTAKYNETVYSVEGSTVNIYGGHVETIESNYSALYLSDNNTTNVTGGTIGKILVYGANLTVSGDANIADIDYEDGIIDLSNATNVDGLTINAGNEELTVGTNLILPEGMQLQVKTLPVDKLKAFERGVVSHAHVGGTATCDKQAICDICDKPYGTKPDHSMTGESCDTCGLVATMSVTDGYDTYYAIDASSLNIALNSILDKGARTFTVTLPTDAEAELFTVIRRAIVDHGGVEYGTINLTIAGATAIPSHDEFDPSKIIFGPMMGGEIECVEELASISLPDVLTIGDEAFHLCRNLTSLYAPKVQTVGDHAFDSTGLTSLELPEVTKIEYAAFHWCESMTKVKLPSVTSIGDLAFAGTKVTYLEITSSEDITIEEGAIGYPETFSQNVDLVLNGNKADEVTDGVFWGGFTFKSITFSCEGGTTNHAFTYVDNGDGTHSKKCQICNYDGDERAEIHRMNLDENCKCEKCGVEHYLPNEDDCMCVYCKEYIHVLDENCVCSRCSLSAHVVNSTTGICSECNKFAPIASITVDGVTTYYNTFDDALLDAMKTDKCTIVLENDCKRDFVTITTGDITIDLNGKKLDVGASTGYSLYMTGGRVTVKDSVGGGEAGELIGVLGGTATIESGKISLLISSNSGTVHVVGGEYEQIAINSENAKIIISGGTFDSVRVFSGTKLTLDQLLKEGYCYYDAEGNVVDVSTIELIDGWYDLTNVTVGLAK